MSGEDKEESERMDVVGAGTWMQEQEYINDNEASSCQSTVGSLDATLASDQGNISTMAVASESGLMDEEELDYDYDQSEYIPPALLTAAILEGEQNQETRDDKLTDTSEKEKEAEEMRPATPTFPMENLGEICEFEPPSPKETKFAVGTTDEHLPIDFESTVTKLGEPNEIVCLVNKDGRITPSAVLQYVLDVDQPYDTVISCMDGRVGAHRLVVASASPFIGAMFCSHNHRLGEVAVLILPDVRLHIMRALLNFCYTGRMIFHKEDEQEIFETMQFLLMGEMGSLTKTEVIVKGPPQPSTSAGSNAIDNSASAEHEQRDHSRTGPPSDESLQLAAIAADTTLTQREPQPHHSNFISTRQETPRRERKKALKTMSSPATSDDENDQKEDESSSSEEDEKSSLDGTAENMNERGNVQWFSSLSRGSKSGKELPNCNFLIASNPGGKTKKLMCYHCPGAFKSTDTLTTHLDDCHGKFLRSRAVEKSELAKLLDCESCDSKHTNIAAANQCLSRSHKTRCYVCFAAIKGKDFENHMRSFHSIEQRSGSCIVVKCNWCDAGIMFQKPMDNKLVAGHCYSEHFKNIDYSSQESSEYDIFERIERKPKEKATVASSNVHHHQPVEPVVKPVIASTSKAEMTNNSNTTVTPRPAGGKPKPVPIVLAMLQRASQKRKLVQEAQPEEAEPSKVIKDSTNIKGGEMKPPKRPRFDGESKKQVSRRTGKPVGFLVDLTCLHEGVPKFTSRKSAKGSKSLVNGCVMVDVLNIPKTFIRFDYGKNFILDECEWKQADKVSQTPEKESSIESIKIKEKKSLVDETEKPPQFEESVNEVDEADNPEQVVGDKGSNQVHQKNDKMEVGNVSSELPANDDDTLQQTTEREMEGQDVEEHEDETEQNIVEEEGNSDQTSDDESDDDE